MGLHINLGQLTPGVDPNWYLNPCFFINLNNLVHRMLLNTLKPISISVTLRHLFGLERSPIFGTGTSCPSFHSAKSASSYQYWLKKVSRCVIFLLLSDLNAFGHTLLRPGALSFASFAIAVLSSAHVIGSFNSYIFWRCLISSIRFHSIGRFLLKTFLKCGPNTYAFSLSVVAIFPVGRRIHMMVGFAWWLVVPPVSILTLSRAALGLKLMLWFFFAWYADHDTFAREKKSVTLVYACRSCSLTFFCVLFIHVAQYGE